MEDKVLLAEHEDSTVVAKYMINLSENSKVIESFDNLYKI